MDDGRLVLLDTVVLRNFCVVDRLDLLGELAAAVGLRFAFPGEVWDELRVEDHRRRVCSAVRARQLRRIRLNLEGHQVDLARAQDAGLDLGEAACAVLAAESDGLVATDDRRARRVLCSLLGEGNVMTSASLVVLAIRHGLLTVADADSFLPAWRRNRFWLRIASFQEMLR